MSAFTPTRVVRAVRSKYSVSVGTRGLSSSSCRIMTVKGNKGSTSSRKNMMMDIAEFGDDEGSGDDDDNRTDEEKGLTHGYEGGFKIGDKVKVVIDTRMFAKPYDKSGFNPEGMEGEVKAILLYGRKKKSLCSAITPIQVTFAPGNVGVPSEFERKFNLHFNSDEVTKILCLSSNDNIK